MSDIRERHIAYDIYFWKEWQTRCIRLSQETKPEVPCSCPENSYPWAVSDCSRGIAQERCLDPSSGVGFNTFHITWKLRWWWLRLPRQEVGVQSLVGELRSHITSQPENQNIKQKQSCNKFNKDFKKWVTLKNILLRLETSKRGRPNAPSWGSSQRDLDTAIPKELGLPFLEGEILGS